MFLLMVVFVGFVFYHLSFDHLDLSDFYTIIFFFSFYFGLFFVTPLLFFFQELWKSREILIPSLVGVPVFLVILKSIQVTTFPLQPKTMVTLLFLLLCQTGFIASKHLRTTLRHGQTLGLLYSRMGKYHQFICHPKLLLTMLVSRYRTALFAEMILMNEGCFYLQICCANFMRQRASFQNII